MHSILFRLAQDEFLLVLVTRPKQILWPALRNYPGQSRMTMASHEEVLRVTG